MKRLFFLKNTRSKLDPWLILSVVVLVVIGLIAIYDSSVITAFRDFSDRLYYFKNQSAWVAIGFLGLIFFSSFDYHHFLKLAPLIFALSTILLLLVLIPFVGTEVLGARRWINIGSFTFQPSEFAKLGIIFYATHIMTKLQNYTMRLTDALIVYFLPIIFVSFFVLIQPDLGTSLIFIFLALTIYFLGNAPAWHFLVVLPPIIIGTILMILIKPYRLDRIRAFLDPNYDPSGVSYQISQIIIALASGGLLGVGLGGARSKFEFIPEVQNDAIFAVIVEETGFLGALVLISIFLFLISRTLKIASSAHDFSGKLLALAITTSLTLQIFINIASNVALIPLTGIPLPFISYGGSSLFVTLCSIGILINIKKQS